MNKGVNLNNHIFEYIDRVYKNGDIKYLLSKYIDTNYWLNPLREFFINNSIESFTDFNYSTCFTMYINSTDNSSKTGTQEFNDFIINNGCMYRVQLQISVIAPYANVKYIKYEYKDGNIQFFSSSSPFCESHLTILNKIKEFLNKFNLQLLNDEVLSLEINDVSLELREKNITVYNCLFEDGY